VLCNLYRNQKDSIGYHADNEPELGKNPVIASVSLGAVRKFKLKHKLSKKVIEVELASGSLLVMKGEVQNH
jgi:alkylated DNA repair dioxygenase AlkB